MADKSSAAVSPKPKIADAFIHGEYIRGEKGTDWDAYVGFVKNVETGKVSMKIVKNPVVNVWVTNDSNRVYSEKREWEPKTRLDEYTTRYLYRGEALWNALNSGPDQRYRRLNYVDLKKQMSSPYVYGADIDFGVRMKHRFQKLNGGRRPTSYNVGSLDIETDVNGSKQVILITFINGDGETYVGVLKEFFQGFVPYNQDKLVTGQEYFTSKDGGKTHIHLRELLQHTPYGSSTKVVKEVLSPKLHLHPDDVPIYIKASHTTDEVENMWHSKVEQEFRSKLNKKTLPIYDKAPKLNLHVKILDDEVTLIKWIFDNIHACRPDFVTIWNMGYDIPYIIDRLNVRGVNPADIFCHPDIPKELRVCWYKKDKGKKGDHITDHWDVFHLTDYTKYIDAMCMYGRLRKAKTRKPSYQLNAIAADEIGTGKLEFGDDGEDINDHYTMQAYKKVKYAVYNIVDVLLLRVLELKNNDTRTMNMLIGDSLLDDFSRQSVQLKNTFFVYLDALGGVPGAVGETLEKPWDKYLTNKGGQVLSPDRTRGTGVSILVETDLISFVHKLVCDIDVSSIDLTSRL